VIFLKGINKASLWILNSNFLMLCFSVKDVMKKLLEYVDDINDNIEKLDSRGPVSKYVLPDENLRGRSLSLSLSSLHEFRQVIWILL
jgi:hypothetical protein